MNVRLLLALGMVALIFAAFAEGRWQVWPVAFLSAFPTISTGWSARHSPEANSWLLAGFGAMIMAGLYMQAAPIRSGGLPNLWFVAAGSTFLGLLLTRIGRRR